MACNTARIVCGILAIAWVVNSAGAQVAQEDVVPAYVSGQDVNALEARPGSMRTWTPANAKKASRDSRAGRLSRRRW